MSASRVDTIHAVTSSLSLVLMRGQLRYLQANGFRPAVLTSPGQFAQETESQESAPVFMVPMKREISPLSDFTSWIRIWRMLRAIRPTICNAGTPKAGLLVMSAACLARVPIRLYTMRGLRLETGHGLKRALLYLTELIACASAHRVICVSPSLRDRAVSLKLVAAGKTVVLGRGSSNGIDVGRFAPTPERLKVAAQIRRDLNLVGVPVIGYVGRLTRDKGLHDLMAAFDRVRRDFSSLSLLIIGNPEEGDAVDAQLRARIVSGAGIVSLPFQADIAPYYLSMDVFVLPTYREGFPNTVLEAQAAEKPIVTTTATGAVDSIVDGESGVLVRPGDVGALAEAIGSLLANPEKARRMGQAGRLRVEREFRQERVWGELAELYRTLLRERGLPVATAENSSERLCLQKQ